MTGAGGSASAKPNTVLVIEDMPDVRKALAKMLRIEGFDVLQAGDGSEAMHLYSAHSAEVVAATLDMMMPTTDGRELLAMLSSIAPRLPIVISTALPVPDNLIGRLPGSPGIGYLQKPYTAQELVVELRRVIAEVEPAP